MSGEQALTSYLGFPLLLAGERQVIVYRPDGRKLATVGSVSGARRFVRGYRRADRSST